MGTLLFNRTEYTLQESTIRVSRLVSFACANGYPAIGIADRNVLFAAQKARRQADQAGIKIIYGMEASVQSGEKIREFLVYAKNDDGFMDISRLSTRIQEEYGNPQPVPIGEFPSYLANAYVIYPDTNEEFERILRNGDAEGLAALLSSLQKAVPNLWIGYSHVEEEYRTGNRQLIEAARRLSLRTVALPFACCEDESQWEGFCALAKLRQADAGRWKGRILHTKEIWDSYDPESAAASDEIAASCRVEFRKMVAELPECVQQKKGISPSRRLEELAKEGLRKRLGSSRVPQEYAKRLSYELSVIESMNYTNYFLIVQEMILYAVRDRQILVGPGRGSAPGSLTAYCMGITDVDPIPAGLLFERFLNKDRRTMPDIDTDVPSDRRDEIFRHLEEAYGRECTAHITAFGSFQCAQTLNDLAELYSLTSDEKARMERHVRRMEETLKREDRPVEDVFWNCESRSPEYREWIGSEERLRRFHSAAVTIEGLPRLVNQHAAGVVISRRALKEITPLLGAGGSCRTQYTKEDLQDLGLIKFDLLSSEHLRYLSLAERRIRAIDPSFRLRKAPRDDKETFALLSTGRNGELFQSGGAGLAQQKYREFKPASLSDVAMIIALIRPAAMAEYPVLLERRNGKQKVTYPDPCLKPILQETYGIFVYQEQVMQASRVMAGFSGEDADALRRAISRKDSSAFADSEQKFVDGALAQGHSEKAARQVFSLMRDFGGYGFNKSHACAYALVAYMEAYVKAHYPAVWCSILLEGKGLASQRELVGWMQEKGIPLERPDVRMPGEKEGEVRLPLHMIRGISPSDEEKIRLELKENGAFQGWIDAVLRLYSLGFSREKVLVLIQAGAMDSLDPRRRSMILTLPSVWKYAGLITEKDPNGRMVLNRSILEEPAMVSAEGTSLELLEKEKELLGMYLSEHPVKKIRKKIRWPVQSVADALKRRGEVSLLVLVEDVREKITRSGKSAGRKMALLEGSDETGRIRLAAFAEIYEENRNLLRKGSYIYIKGFLDPGGKYDSCRIESVSEVKEG